MSTTTDPDAPTTAPPADFGPSATVAQEPTFARVIGFAGLFGLVLGVVAVITTRAFGPRIISEGMGYLFAAAGLAMMLYHAVRDGEIEVRRLYGGFGVFLLLFALAAALVPGPVFGSPGNADKVVGFNLLPWGVGAGLLSLMFLVPYGRHETDPAFRTIAEYLLLGVGGALTVGGVLAGAFSPDFLTGPGVALALLGLGFLCGYLGLTDTTDGLGYTVAVALGVLGAAMVVGAVARSAVPTLLYEGPEALRKPNGALDGWRVAGRLLIGAVFVAILGWAVRGKMPLWVKGAVGAVGLFGAGVLVLASTKAGIVTSLPAPFLVPSGVLLTGLGLVFLMVSVGVCSDSQFVTLTRRELAAYFFSPIGYIVLLVMAGATSLGYMLFIGVLNAQLRNGGVIPEPILQHYYALTLVGPIFVIFIVPALTMRLFAEEWRTGSMEVLLTAPVSEARIVLSKFLGCWLFFMLVWVPAGLFLLGLRVEGGASFDYRPLFSAYLAIGVTGAALIAIGMFFSSLSRNQIVAAALTCVVMAGLWVVQWSNYISIPALGETGRTVMARFSYATAWDTALTGQLPLRDVLLFASVGVFWLFLTTKVLEARKWG